MTVGAPGEDLRGSEGRELRLVELVALGLLVVEGVVILGYVAAAIANQVQFGGAEFGNEGTHAWGYTLTLASQWAAPWAVVVFLFAPLALVAWIGRRDGDEDSAARGRFVLQLALLLAVLTVIGGTLSVVGRAMQVSPAQNWSLFLGSLGTGIGSVLLGLLAAVVVKRLADDMHFDLLHNDADDPTEEDVGRD